MEWVRMRDSIFRKEAASFELAAAMLHWSIAFKWVRIPHLIAANKKEMPVMASLFCCLWGTKRMDLRF